MAETSNESLVIKLFGAVTELEQSINRARGSLGQMECVPSTVITRMSSYDGVLASQRKYINELSTFVKQGNTPEIARLVNLINQLSAMIKDDVRSILTSLSNTPKAENSDQINFC